MNYRGNYVHFLGRIIGYGSNNLVCKVSLFENPNIVLAFRTNQGKLGEFTGTLIDFYGYFSNTFGKVCLEEKRSIVLEPDYNPTWFEMHHDAIYEQYELWNPTKITSDYIPEEEDPEGWVVAAEAVLINESTSNSLLP